MLRCGSSLYSELLPRFLPTAATVQFQSVRWKRKPRKPFWLGTAKSKRFKIPEQPKLAPEEALELHRLDGQYRTSMRSIRKYFESAATKRRDELEAQLHIASPAEIDASLTANEEWNKQSALFRQKRLEEKALKHQELVESVVAKKKAQEKSILDRIQQIVIQEKENSNLFVTPENIDEKIEECLSTVTDYNYALDLQGQMYIGYEAEMKPGPLKTDYCKREKVEK